MMSMHKVYYKADPLGYKQYSPLLVSLQQSQVSGFGKQLKKQGIQHSVNKQKFERKGKKREKVNPLSVTT